MLCKHFWCINNFFLVENLENFHILIRYRAEAFMSKLICHYGNLTTVSMNILMKTCIDMIILAAIWEVLIFVNNILTN